MTEEYSEIGGARWGQTYLASWNATWPFATLQVSAQRIQIKIRLFWLEVETFIFNRQENVLMEKYESIFTTGLLVKHSKKQHPPFIVFWTFDYPKLKNSLEQFGYQVTEHN